MDDWLPLTKALEVLESQYGARLHRSNLSGRRDNGAAPSPLEELETEGQARRIQRGTRHFWEVAASAIPILAERAASARPGPPPGAQVTLDANQLTVFVTYLALTPDPAGALPEALHAATGVAAEGVERIVIPLVPRRPKSPVAGPTQGKKPPL